MWNRHSPKYFITFLFCFIFLMGAWTGVGVAQPTPEKPELKFLRIHEGLISNRVSAIYQDHLGFMWFGTHSGLHRYDGIDFHIYSSNPDSNSISDNYIGTIYEDKNNNLWIGTGGGIERYNRATDSFTTFELEGNSQIESGESVIVNSILEDKNDRLWIASSGKGLFYFDREKQDFILHDRLGTYTINSIAVDDENNLWIATFERGLIQLDIDNNEVAYFTHDPSDPQSLSSNLISQVLTGPEGNLWIGTSSSGLNRMDLNEDETVFYHYKHEPDNANSLGNNSIYTLFSDRNGKLWVGNENGGLHLYDREYDLFYHYDSYPDDPNSLSHNSIWSIFQDRQERLWVGTAQAGVNVIDNNYSKFDHYFKNPGTDNSLNNNIVRDFWEDDDANIWIATDGGGLNYLNRETGRFRAFEHDPGDPRSLGSNAVISLNQDDRGSLWVGTWGGGLNILTDKENGHFISFNERFNNDYPINNVFGVGFDGDILWISAFEEGLYKFNKNSREIELFNSVQEDSSTLTTNFVLSNFIDSKGNIWVATLVGLNLLKAETKEDGVFRRFYHSDEDSSTIAGNSIRQIFEDRNQNIWIATDGGLSKYLEDEGRFKNYYQSDGLPVNEIRSIIEDDSGNLWIGTIKGLSKFDPVQETFTNYDMSDGLQSNEFSRYSVHKTRSGELLFGGLSGFNIFHPDNIQKNPHIPPVYLTDFKLFSRSVNIADPESPLKKHISVADTLILSYQQDVFTFDFIALNYTRPEYNEYAYMIEGFEEDWNEVGTQRNATYTNLDPGEYTFRVKASNNDSIWNEEGASLTLIITPPFWQTTWFYLLAAFLIAGTVFSVYQLRVRNIRKRNRQLEQQVAERTEELKNKNKDLEVTLNELKATKDELVEKAHKAGMADIATGVLHNVGNVLTSVNTSASLIEETAKKSKVEGLVQANLLLRENIDRIEEFIAKNPKGKNLLKYYLKLEDPLKKEQQKLLSQSHRLIEKIELINEIIAAQQSYAGTGIHAEEVSLSEIIENALSLQAGSIERHSLHVEKDFQITGQVVAQRSKLIHVLVNIFKNAKDAMTENAPENRKVFIKTWQEGDRVYLSVSDNGSGIKNEHLDKIFTQGFTTKRKGHGFGLHSSANYMKEMNGAITVDSSDKNQGATFTISLPLQSKVSTRKAGNKPI